VTSESTQIRGPGRYWFMADSPRIVWFRRDLRLADHPALYAALTDGAPVVPVFVWSPEEDGGWGPGGAARWWLQQSLQVLAASLEKNGSRLLIRTGSAGEALTELAREVGAVGVEWNYLPDPAAREAAARAALRLAAAGVPSREHRGDLPFDPEVIRTGAGQPYRVFTPFWRACRASEPPPEPLSTPARIPAPERWPASLPLADLGLEPRPDWAGGLQETWQPGEADAGLRLTAFLDRIAEYERERDRPALAATTCLSPHLHHGEISPRTVWSVCVQAAAERPAAREGVACPAAGARVARIRLLPAAPLSGDHRSAVSAGVRGVPCQSGPGGPARVAARTHRLPAGGRGHAPALANRLDAQPCPYGDGILPCQAPAPALADGSPVVLRHVGGC